MPIRLQRVPQQALLAPSAPAEPPPAGAVIGEDDLNWQNLHMLDDDADDDVIIELE
jgi:hypothetical protein